MPNHVVNFVKASPHVLHALLNLRGPKPHVDFNQVIPSTLVYSPALVGFASMFVERAFPILVTLSQADRIRFFKIEAQKKENQSAFFPGELPLEAELELIFQNKVLTGFTDGLDWNIHHWGTKWNAYDFMINLEEGDPFIVFQTAWSSPFNVFAKLSEMFPGEMVSVAFADEDIGNNFGLVGFVEGAYTKLTPHIFMNQKIKELNSIYEFCVNLHKLNHPLFTTDNWDIYFNQLKAAAVPFYEAWRETNVHNGYPEGFEYLSKLAKTPFTGLNSDI